MKKRTIAASIAAGTTALLLLGAPLAASAHVHVDPDQATPGSYATLTFTVPTESATAGTVKLVVDLPTDDAVHLGHATCRSPAGRRRSTPRNSPSRLRPTTAPSPRRRCASPGRPAAALQVAPGQFQQFTISAGAVPDVGQLVLPTHQTYSDGTVVDWTEKTPASGKEPEHPAPTLYVNDPAPAGDESPLVAHRDTRPGAGRRVRRHRRMPSRSDSGSADWRSVPSHSSSRCSPRPGARAGQAGA